MYIPNNYTIYMGKYNCDTCFFSSNDFSNYKRHINSRMHLRKVEQVKTLNEGSCKYPEGVDSDYDLTDGENPKKLTDFTCEHCNRSFTRNCGLANHVKVCPLRDRTIEKLKKEHLKEIEQLKAEYERQMAELKMTMKEKEIISGYEVKLATQKADLLENSTNFDREIIRGAGQVVQNQQDALRFLTENYKETPGLLAFNNIKALKNYKDEEVYYSEDSQLWRILVAQYRDRKLVEYLARFLAKEYKNEQNPEQQSIWSSDESRLVFLYRKAINNNKSIWKKDIKAVDLKELVFIPFKNALLKDLNSVYNKQYKILLKDNRKEIRGIEFDEKSDELMELKEILTYMRSEKFVHDLVRKICPLFSFNLNEQNENKIKMIK